MKTIQEIKDEYAINDGFLNFDNMIKPGGDMIYENALNSLMKRYAEEVLKEAAEKLSIEEINLFAWRKWEENAKTNPNPINPGAFVYGFKVGYNINKDSILNIIKELK